MLQPTVVGYPSALFLSSSQGLSSSGSEGGSPGPPPLKSFTIDAILGLHPQQPSSIALDYSNRRAHGVDRRSCEVLVKKSSKSKRVRTIFTPEQLERLEAEFERQQYMVGPERLYLAHALQLTEAQVKVWFQNRRIKWRKQHLEMQQQRLAVLKQQRQLHQQQRRMVDSETESNSGCEEDAGFHRTEASLQN